MRRRWFILGLAVLVAVVMVIGALPRPERPLVSREQFQKIEDGMTRAEVEAIIGGPPGDYTPGPHLGFTGSFPYATCDSWAGNGGMIWVRFDDTGHAHWRQFEEITPLDEPSVIDRVRAWLGF